MTAPVQAPRRWMRVRIVLLGATLMLGAGSVLVRAWDLQWKRSPVLKRMAEQQYLRDVRLAPKRGTIYDRHGSELAVSVDVDSVWANPRAMRKAGIEPAHATELLSKHLEIDREIVLR
ncbi:MAG: hypothetical protein MJD61_13770, partial [Proteobacteria bacterium]|nr:hypothetical protein [Pseudomonadota bacterium]